MIDSRISRVTLEDAPVSYRSFVEHPLHRNLPEVLAPDVLRRYDIGDLLLAVAPRPVTLIDPVDAVGQPLRRPELTRVLGAASVRVLHRGRGDPLRWE